MTSELIFTETKRVNEKANFAGRANQKFDSEKEQTTQNRTSSPAKYRNRLPQTKKSIFLTDGGLETTLIFRRGLDLPGFAAFPMLETESGISELRDYYWQYAAHARDLGIGFILESVTWRANFDWAAKLGYSEAQLANVNLRAIEFLCEIRDEFETEKSPMVISGCVGPRGDGYAATEKMTADEAQEYHAGQIRVFSETAADLISAFTLNYPEEAVGIARAAQAARIPAVISFTVETDGKLPSGQTLKDAITTVDAATDNYPAYFMINCAHPAHFENVLTPGEAWLARIGGIRANASTKSHAELDESTELDRGNPAELAEKYRTLFARLPNLRVIGGCCGTDFEHIEKIASGCIA